MKRRSLIAGTAAVAVAPAAANAAPVTPKPADLEDIVEWFNAWLREPIDSRDRVIIDSVMDYVAKYPDGVRKIAERQRRWRREE